MSHKATEPAALQENARPDNHEGSAACPRPSTEMASPVAASDTTTDVEMHASEEETKTDDEAVTVNIKFIHRDPITLQCSPSITIANLKKRVCELHDQGSPQDQNDSSPSTEQPRQPLRLIYKGKVLKDDQTLASYNFVDQDTIHAVFSRRSQVQFTTNETTPDTAATRDASSTTTTTTSNSGTGTPPLRENVFVVDFEGDQRAAVPDVARLISSVMSSAMRGNENVSATIRFHPEMTIPGAPTPPSTSPSSQESQTATSTEGVPSPTPSMPRAVPQVPTPAPSTSPAPSLPSATPQMTASQLLREAAALRRSIPALELAPLSRPSELSVDLYNLGNATREAGDTYLAIHRQLQFISTRLLQDYSLSEGERARLRTRIQELIPVMHRLSTMSTSVAQQLASSPYGTATEARMGNPDVSAPPSNTSAQPPLAGFLGDLLQIATSLQQTRGNSNASTSTAPLGDVLPNLLSSVSSLMGGQVPVSVSRVVAPEASEPGRESVQPAPSSMPPVVAIVADSTPFRSFAPKLQARLMGRADLEDMSFEDIAGLILPTVVEHVFAFCSTGAPQFIQAAVDEVENTMVTCHASRNLAYARDEFHRSTVRTAIQDLLQITVTDERVRLTKLMSWMRRSCSHLFAELCDSLPAATAAEITAETAVRLMSNAPPYTSPFLRRVSTDILEFLEHRFTVARH